MIFQFGICDANRFGMFENINQRELEEVGFIGAIICGSDGSVVEATSDELEVFGSILGYISQVADMIGEPFGMDSIEEIHLESANTKAVCIPQEDEILGFLCNGRANTDLILNELVN
jgi:predicted regulator of Ras-like GTPase activity (Roadblock/LC7/MglB family)